MSAVDSHVMCAVCSTPEKNFYSLGVNFTAVAAGKTEGHFIVEPRHQGYLGLLHGGIASSLLDAAMTHCLLLQEIPALTAQLDVRFHHPIKVGDRLTVIGQCHDERRGIYFLSAQLLVNGERRVSAKGRFLCAKKQSQKD
ncbi:MULTISPECIES: PaaI family thioesterase [unclassified Vibrio]|uniref:PaaI family thioesterase n=2 Tax=Vibrio TaxID=662 RepID=UPI0013736222|nr:MULTISPECIES: PaaI family thioesterase [unclassified Vibrio]NAX06377.1 hotdog fold thioesterase [Vibrio sp. V30_P3S12P165]NNN44972.1 PaaI family thioesterase [Vibrio sp. 1-1(7)]NNN72345.1 PaaI family thioesterase [Vibrio sp. 12-2(3-a)]